MTFTSPNWLFLAVLIAIAVFVLAWLRSPAVPRATFLLVACGILAFVLAAGGISCRRGHEPRIAVMVDCSPSTRGGSFRDLRWVRSRVNELLGTREYQLYEFADTTKALNDDEAIVEMPADHTSFDPPAVDQVILFSDGRFDAPPVTPPVHVVIDPALASPVDAAVVDLNARGDELAADVRNTGSPRTLTWENAHRKSTTAPSGSTILTTRNREAPVAPAPGATSARRGPRPPTFTETVTARLAPGDLWPENDALSIRPSPAMASQRWWIGDAAPSGWINLSPENLPLENSAWLGPAIVVLNDVPADALSPQQQDRLTQYVRDLGGALVIAGGEHAFAAGHYPGSALESLSPLSSSPPEPVNHWVLLVDASGSMSAPAQSGTRFKLASDALVSVLRELPKSDLVSIGSFARDLRWWSMAKNAQDTTLLKLPPADVTPTGPTNLEAALQQIIASVPTSPPINLLVLTDAEAEFPDPTKLADELKSHHIRVDALLVGDALPDSPLHHIVQATGGQFVQESDPQKWTTSVRRILRAQMPDELIREPLSVTFSGLLQSLPPRTVSPINRTWLKQSATSLAESLRGADKLAVAARWSMGAGDVLAVGFHPNDAEIDAIDKAIARPPRDPRFKIDWHNGATLHIRIDAIDAGQYLNNEQLTLAMSPGSREPIPQTAPGRYEIDLPAPRSPATATLLRGDQVLDRFAVAGRYPREFDQVGNDLAALHALADRSGGSVIEPSQHERIEIPDTREISSAAGAFAILGFVLFGAGLVVWRRF